MRLSTSWTRTTKNVRCVWLGMMGGDGVEKRLFTFYLVRWRRGLLTLLFALLFGSRVTQPSFIFYQGSFRCRYAALSLANSTMLTPATHLNSNKENCTRPGHRSLELVCSLIQNVWTTNSINSTTTSQSHCIQIAAVLV